MSVGSPSASAWQVLHVPAHESAIVNQFTELTALTEWFSAHQSEWKKSSADVGPEKFVYLLRDGVAVAYFNLTGNTLYAASYSRVLTPAEQQALEKILAE